MNGTETARLILRATVGSVMIAHGVRHGRTLDGTARWFRSIGFERPRLQAAVSAGVEVGAGSALILGAATPLAAAAVVGTMAVAGRSVHADNGFFVNADGYEYVLTLGSAAVALSALGAGTLSVDRMLSRGDERLTGAQRAALAAGVGLAGAALQLLTFWRPQPEDASASTVDESAAEPTPVRVATG